MCGIFGYINYLVEKDRKYILDTLVNGKLANSNNLLANLYSRGAAQVSPASSTVATTRLVSP